MNHPTREEWMAYLYGEAPEHAQSDAAAHLETCAECRANVAAWRDTMSALDRWKLSEGRPRPSAALIKWGVAALLMIGVGYGVGRLSASAATDRKSLRAEVAQALRPMLESELKRKLHQELNGEIQTRLAAVHSQLTNALSGVATAFSAANAETERLLAAYESKRLEDYQALLISLQQSDSQRTTDYESLRKELETVAILTQESLRRTHQDLVELASFSQPIPDSQQNKQ
jgi:hypothetical protein